MKLVVKVAIAAALLNGSAHAEKQPAVSGAASLHGQGKVGAVRHTAHTGKKSKVSDKHAGKTSQQIIEVKKGDEDPEDSIKQDAATDAPAESLEQTVQLRGVRG
jgi:hypothetical protein